MSRDGGPGTLIHFTSFPLFSPADVAEFAALLNHLSMSLLDAVACLV